MHHRLTRRLARSASLLIALLGACGEVATSPTVSDPRPSALSSVLTGSRAEYAAADSILRAYYAAAQEHPTPIHQAIMAYAVGGSPRFHDAGFAFETDPSQFAETGTGYFLEATTEVEVDGDGAHGSVTGTFDRLAHHEASTVLLWTSTDNTALGTSHVSVGGFKAAVLSQVYFNTFRSSAHTCKQQPLNVHASSVHTARYPVIIPHPLISVVAEGAWEVITDVSEDRARCDQVPHSVVVGGFHMNVGDPSASLFVEFRDEAGNAFACKEPYFSSDEPSVAVVNQLGSVTPVGVGTASITVTCQGVTGSDNVIVESPTGTGSGPGGGSTGEPGPSPGPSGPGGGSTWSCWTEYRWSETAYYDPELGGYRTIGTWTPVTVCQEYHSNQRAVFRVAGERQSSVRPIFLVVTDKVPGNRGVAVVRGSASDTRDYLLIDAKVVRLPELLFALKKAPSLSTVEPREAPRAFAAEGAAAPPMSAGEAGIIGALTRAVRAAPQTQTPFGRAPAVAIDLSQVLRN